MLHIAFTARKRHQRFYSEDLIPLALFDPPVQVFTKKKIAQNIKFVPERCNRFKRIGGKAFTQSNPLEFYATKRSVILFIMKNGNEEAHSFLLKHQMTRTQIQLTKILSNEQRTWQLTIVKKEELQLSRTSTRLLQRMKRKTVPIPNCLSAQQGIQIAN